MMSVESQPVEFVSLLDYDEYEILTVYPFTIRRKDNHYEVSEFERNGYSCVYLNKKNCNKHVLVAKQFIPNPNNLPQVDHINRNRTDYHIENLRWVSARENSLNKSSSISVQYNFLDTISDDAIVVRDYNNHTFENYYYDETTDKFYFFNGQQYRELHINEKKNNHILYVYMTDIDNKRICVYYNKFKQIYNISD